MAERKLQLLSILNRYDFSALAAAEENPKIRRRFLGLDLLKQGKNFREAAEIIEVSWYRCEIGYIAMKEVISLDSTISHDAVDTAASKITKSNLLEKLSSN